MDWIYRLFGTKTTTTLSFSPAALFVVRNTFVAVHERPNVVHLYHYSEDIREELFEFFQDYVEEGEDKPPIERMYIKQTRPYEIGDITIDVHDDVIYTAGKAFAAHSHHTSILSKRINVYTSMKAYVEG